LYLKEEFEFETGRTRENDIIIKKEVK